MNPTTCTAKEVPGKRDRKEKEILHEQIATKKEDESSEDRDGIEKYYGTACLSAVLCKRFGKDDQGGLRGITTTRPGVRWPLRSLQPGEERHRPAEGFSELIESFKV